MYTRAVDIFFLCRHTSKKSWQGDIKSKSKLWTNTIHFFVALLYRVNFTIPTCTVKSVTLFHNFLFFSGLFINLSDNACFESSNRWFHAVNISEGSCWRMLWNIFLMSILAWFLSFWWCNCHVDDIPSTHVCVLYEMQNSSKYEIKRAPN